MEFLQISKTTTDAKKLPAFLLEIFHSSIASKLSGIKADTFLPKCSPIYALNIFPVPSQCFIGIKLVLYMNPRKRYLP